MLEFIKLVSVKLTLTPTLKWYTHLPMVDTQLSTLLLMAMFIRLEYTELLSQQCPLIPMESTLPSQALTILDTLASTDTLLHTTTMSGTEPNTNTCINHGQME